MPDNTIQTRCQHFKSSTAPTGPFIRLSIMFSHKSCCQFERTVAAKRPPGPNIL
jgi:hypothetical protein